MIKNDEIIIFKNFMIEKFQQDITAKKGDKKIKPPQI